MRNLKRIKYISRLTGIRQSVQAWLEVIADKQFNLEYILMDELSRFQVKTKFVEMVKSGVLVEL